VAIEVQDQLHYVGTMTQTNETAFGFRQVEQGEKQGLVNEVFAKSAARYDQMNDLMSGCTGCGKMISSPCSTRRATAGYSRCSMWPVERATLRFAL
jgi:hypothetical protein